MGAGQDDRESAEALVVAHGCRARQLVVDRMVAALRRHDLDAAKRWDRVGVIVDQRLGAGAGMRVVA